MKNNRLPKFACSSIFLMLVSTANVYAGFTPVPATDWNEGAVRKVLQTFAYGGLARESQIAAWGKMPPQLAIQEMLTFDAVNAKLSPPQDGITNHAGSLDSLRMFWQSTASDNYMYIPSLLPQALDLRPSINLLLTNPTTGAVTLNFNGLPSTWLNAINKRGINTFRHKIGLWLTNYPLAISLGSESVNPVMLRTFYDDIVSVLEKGGNYDEIAASAASSAIVAVHYVHRNNTYGNTTKKFSGNDDFAREFHQLYFGIYGERNNALGAVDEAYRTYHENITIPNTARLLTGMQVELEKNAFGSTAQYNRERINFSDYTYTTHPTNPSVTINNFTNHYRLAEGLQILGTTVLAGNTAKEGIATLAKIAITDVESLQNLPVYIIQSLADDNLDDATKTVIRDEWVGTPNKNLLTFIRNYAISTAFHSPSRFKYQTSADRNVTAYLQNTIDNKESYFSTTKMTSTLDSISLEGGRLFFPAHGIFGGQTGPEAAANVDVFKVAYNRRANSPASITAVDDALVKLWKKDWTKIMPKDANGAYSVGHVGAWLWNRFIADGGKNFGALERANVSELLALGTDLKYVGNAALLPENDPALSASIGANEAKLLQLSSTDLAQRKIANIRVGRAIDFITATPFMFGQEGK